MYIVGMQNHQNTVPKHKQSLLALSAALVFAPQANLSLHESSSSSVSDFLFSLYSQVSLHTRNTHSYTNHSINMIYFTANSFDLPPTLAGLNVLMKTARNIQRIYAGW
jgi:hypothetical protein